MITFIINRTKAKKTPGNKLKHHKYITAALPDNYNIKMVIGYQ